MTTFSDWLNQVEGNAIDVDGNWGPQCWDLWSHYAQNIFGCSMWATSTNAGGTYHQPGYACEIWHNFATGPLGTWFTPVSADQPAQAGDVALWEWGSAVGPLSHVAIAVEDRGGNVLCMTQNPGAPRYANLSKAGLLGYLRPDDQSPFGGGTYSGEAAPTGPAANTVGSQGEGIRGSGSGWTYWVPGTDDQKTVQSRLAERGLYSGPIDGDLASDASVRAIKLACGNLGFFDLNYWDGEINKNLCYGILLLAQNYGGYDGFNDLYTDGHVWAAFDGGVASAIPVTPAPPAPAPVEETITPEAEATASDTNTSVKPESIEHKEDTMSKPTVSPEAEVNLEELKATQKELASQLKPVDLGSIITNNKARKITWAVYGLVGLFIIAVMGGLTAAQWIAPSWFIFATGAYTAIGPAFASLAMANITTKQ